MSKEIKDGGPVSIALIGGGEALISARDACEIMASKWRIGANGYVYKVGARIKGAQCLLHRIVMSAGNGEEIHHKDRNKLNCQRGNLVCLSASEHQEHHKHILIARNKDSRIYSISANCKLCGIEFIKHSSHRGRQVCCSKDCAIKLAVIARKEIRNAA